MPEQSSRVDLNTLIAKREEYQQIMADLTLLDEGGEASRVQNYNKREAQDLIEAIAGKDAADQVGSAARRGLERLSISRNVTANISVEQAIIGLGHLFYLAGSQMTSVLDATLKALLLVLRDKSRSERPRMLAIKALGEVCWCNADSQKRLLEQGGVQVLTSLVLAYTAVPGLARWACHTLTVVMANSSQTWLHLRDLTTLDTTLVAFANDANLWTNWDNNHAAILHSLLNGPAPGTAD